MDQPQPFSLRYLILRYIVVSVLTALAVMAVYAAIEFLFGIDPSTGGSAVVALVPAMDAGNTFARHNKRLPAKGEAWRISSILFAVHLILGLIVVAAVDALLMGGGILAMMGGVFSTTLGFVGMAVILLVYWLMTRFFFGMGAKGELRRAERLAEKGK